MLPDGMKLARYYCESPPVARASPKKGRGVRGSAAEPVARLYTTAAGAAHAP
jgi:hypothetical protein